jgi:hypothetical protein
MDPIKLVAIACAAYSDKLNDETLLENNSYDAMLALATKDILGRPVYITSALDVDVYVLRYPNQLVVAFRGTDSLRDVCEDAMFALSEWRSGAISGSGSGSNSGSNSGGKAKVHEGIYRQYRSVEKELVEIVEAAKAQGVGVTCTGHSSGAAIACFLATATATNYVGFGAPKVGNAEFSKIHSAACSGSTSCMYVNGADPIPKLPPCADYVHPASIIRVGPRDRLPFLPTLTGLSYHANENYYQAVAHQDAGHGGLWRFIVSLVDKLFNACMSAR